MKTFGLTPRTNNTINGMAFTGGFGQPNGFGPVLEILIKEDGRAELTCTFQIPGKTPGIIIEEMTWSIELDNEQRKIAADFLESYDFTLSVIVKG